MRNLRTEELPHLPMWLTCDELNYVCDQLNCMTHQQRRIFAHYAAFYVAKEIAEALGLSSTTVRRYTAAMVKRAPGCSGVRGLMQNALRLLVARNHDEFDATC
jgi:FixJ family two-component response regulator